MNDKKSYVLTILIALSAVLCSILGYYWDAQYYRSEKLYTPSAPPLATAMQGFHDQLFMADYSSLRAGYSVSNLSIFPASNLTDAEMQADTMSISDIASEPASLLASGKRTVQSSSHVSSLPPKPETYDFTTATDEYFDDACFIGDSRTVGISKYAGIEHATFLCKTSLSIYDYSKPKITYEDSKLSIQDILSQTQFAKIYLMVGINECGIGTAESFFERYRDVVEDIRNLQPEALIFLQGNLFVTKSKSEESESITNENILARNELIATLANQRDIFYIDINESSLCDEGALIPDYTWDQVHIKAQYYPVWKDFLLQHAIVLG